MTDATSITPGVGGLVGREDLDGDRRPHGRHWHTPARPARSSPTVKASLPHGAFLPWLAEHCPAVSARTAQAYMRVAAGWSRLANAQGAAHLSLSGALSLLAEPKAAPSASSPDTDAALLADRDGWQPPPGCFAFVAGAMSDGVPVDVEIQPSAYAGYWYVNVYRPNADGARWGIVDGTQKPLAGWALPRMIGRCLKVDGLDLAAQHWVPAVPPWTYNEVLFDSEGAWRQHWLGGGRG